MGGSKKLSLKLIPDTARAVHVKVPTFWKESEFSMKGGKLKFNLGCLRGKGVNRVLKIYC